MDFTGERYLPNIDNIEMREEHVLRYYFAQQFVSGKVVLDAACGEGYGTKIIAENAGKVYGLDISKETIESAKSKYNINNIEFLEGSIKNIPLEDHSVDVVVSFETIEHVDQETQEQFLEDIKRVLSEDGILIISTPNKKIYSDKYGYNNEFHIKEFYREEFKNLLEKYFKYIKFYGESYQIVNAINSQDLKQNAELSVSTEFSSKYFISVCSNKNMNLSHIRSMMSLSESKDYYKYLDRIIELQHEVEDRNLHIKKLDQHIEELDDAISFLKSDYNKKIQNLNDKLTIKSQERKELKECLDEKTLELQHILNSNGYNLLKKYYALRDKIFPQNSYRRFIAKLTKKVMHNPKTYWKVLNINNLRKLRYYLSVENINTVENRMDMFDAKLACTQQEVIDVSPITQEDEIYEHLVFEKFSNPLVSIIIPVYNQFAYTYKCLKSILENTKDIPYEVIIADDVSNDKTVELGNIVENIKIVRNQKNLRFLLNCNNAAKYASGKYIHFLNNDTQVQKDWLSSLVQLIEKDDSIGLVGSKLVYPNGKLQEAGGILWKDGSAWNYGNGQDPSLPEFNYVKEVDYISGASIMIRADLWKKLGGFDELFVPAYCEDSDLAFSVRKAGYKVVYQPKSVVVHFEGISNGTDVTSGQKYYQIANSKKFYQKWKDVLQAEHFDNAQNVFLARDRSRNKKTILMIDHYVPMFDKDAGSRTVFQYLTLFAREEYNIKFIGDNFYPFQPYTEILQQMGIEVFYGIYYDRHWKDWLKQNCKEIRYVFLNRPHISVKYIDVIREYTDARIIYYGHDLHFLREKREYQLTGNNKLLQSSDKWKEQELELMKKADVTYYPSYIEKQEIHAIAPDILVKVIPAYLYFNLQKPEYNFKNRKNLMFIGGFGHRPNIDAVQWLVKGIMPTLVKLLPDIKIYILGSNPPDEIKKLESDNLKVAGFVTDEELKEYYSNCRLSIVPLRYGAGIKGKVIEGMSYGIPIVTTSIGAEGIVNAKDFLEIADESAAFAKKIADIYNDEQKLKQHSNDGYSYIKKYFSPLAAKEIIASDFDMKI